MSEDHKTAKEHVESWIESAGFALELQTASVFRSAGFDVRQGTYYIDPDTKKPRELDVVASIVSPSGLVDVRLVIECKSSRHPWALLCSPDLLDGYDRLQAFGIMSARSRQFLSDIQADMGKNVPWIHKGGLIGYSLRQQPDRKPDKNERDMGYEASMSVIKACKQHVESPKAGWGGFFITFPTIVVNANLFQCALGTVHP